MYKVVYLPTARKQVLYIVTELSAPEAAERFLEEVEEQIGKLSAYPYRHSVYPAPYAMKNEIRFFPVRNYLVFYVVQEDQQTVEIWRFLHQRQNVTKHL